jgi:hypothetical protein
MDAEEEAVRERLTAEQYVSHLKKHSDARRNKSGYHGVGLRESGRWQARKSNLPVCFPPVLLYRECLRCVHLAASWTTSTQATPGTLSPTHGYYLQV